MLAWLKVKLSPAALEVLRHQLALGGFDRLLQAPALADLPVWLAAEIAIPALHGCKVRCFVFDEAKCLAPRHCSAPICDRW